MHESLLVQEQRMHGYHDEEHLLKVAREDRAGRGICRDAFRGGHGRGRGRQPISKAIIKCFKCHKFKHFQYECTEWENKEYYDELEED